MGVCVAHAYKTFCKRFLKVQVLHVNAGVLYADVNFTIKLTGYSLDSGRRTISAFLIQTPSDILATRSRQTKETSIFLQGSESESNKVPAKMVQYSMRFWSQSGHLELSGRTPGQKLFWPKK